MAKLAAAARADKGMKREANEDSVLAMVVERRTGFDGSVRCL
jgi:hypothetical protein